MASNKKLVMYLCLIIIVIIINNDQIKLILYFLSIINNY